MILIKEIFFPFYDSHVLACTKTSNFYSAWNRDDIYIQLAPTHNLSKAPHLRIKRSSGNGRFWPHLSSEQNLRQVVHHFKRCLINISCYTCYWSKKHVTLRSVIPLVFLINSTFLMELDIVHSDWKAHQLIFLFKFKKKSNQWYNYSIKSNQLKRKFVSNQIPNDIQTF